MDKINLQNLKLFLAVLDEEGDVETKKKTIKKYLDLNAQVNAQDANNNNNTPLHFAVLKDEVEIVRFLREEYKARVDIENDDGQRPRDLAAQLTSLNGQEIFNILGSSDKTCETSAKSKDSVLKKQQINHMKSDILLSVFESDKNPFPKDKGTLGVSGHLYETKLLSLVYLRLRKENKDASQCNEQMEYFYLGTNRPQIGAFDDLYLKYKYKDRKRADVIFIQAKHKLDTGQGAITREALHAKQGNYNLAKYFKAYMKIKHLFGKKESSKDIVFKSNLDDINCMFVIYTVGRPDIKPTEMTPVEKTSLTERDYNLILTGERKHIFQIIPHDSDIEILTRVTLDEELRMLGKSMAKGIVSGMIDITTDELIRRNQVLLAKKVIVVLKPVQNATETHRIGKLSEPFFSSDDEHISTLRGAMFKELVSKSKKRSIKDEGVQKQIHAMLKDPSSKNISKLLGNVVFFDDSNNTLKFIEKIIPEEHQNLVTELKTIQVTKGDIHDAYELMGKKAASKEFKLPLQFGNPDIAVDEANAKHKIDLLSLAFIKLLTDFENTRVIDINSDTFVKKTKNKQSIDARDIASAVGNLLIFDEKTKSMKFNTNAKSLPKYAKMLLKNIQNNIANCDLPSYRLRIESERFPRSTWNVSDIDKVDAKDFFNKLWFFAAQAQEESVEKIVKENIDNLNKASRQVEQNKHITPKVHSEAIYLKLHDVIQKWAMLPKTSYYISDKTEILDRVRQCIAISPLLSILNFMYIVNFENAKIRFNEDAISKLELETLPDSALAIESECTMLTAIKLKQFYEHEDFSFINLDYTLGIFDIDIVLNELKQSDTNILIIVIEQLVNCKTLGVLLNEYKGKAIIVANASMAQELRKYNISDVKLDGNITLDDIVEASQDIILEKKIIFQGYEVKLQELSNDSKHLLKNGILCKIVKDEAVDIGNPTFGMKQSNILQCPYYVSRSLRRGRRDIPINTFNDVNDNVVTIVATAGMGKSTLLRSLFTETKRNNPSFCAIHICLPDYSTALNSWDSANVDLTYVLTLLFKTGLSKTKDTNEIDFTLIQSNGKIALHSVPSCSDCHLFGLHIFIEYFNKGKLTLVFDGFDEICPKYKKQVIQLLKILNSHTTKQRIWITSRPYSDAKRALEETFDSPYELMPLSPKEQQEYLLGYWKVHMNVANFNEHHITNINAFIEYMTQFSANRKDISYSKVKPRCLALHMIYTAAVNFFVGELDNIKLDIDKKQLRKKWNIVKFFTSIPEDSAMEIDKKTMVMKNKMKQDYIDLPGNPLHLYIIAHYLKSQIKCVDLKPKWDLVMNSYALHEHFVRTKIIKICYEEKDEHVISKATEEIRYENEIIEFKEKHKRISMLTFYTEELLELLFTPKEMEEARRNIRDIEGCREKRGFVDDVENGVPKFVHLIFAEYFAVEYVCDKLKTVLLTNKENDDVKLVLGFVMNIFLFEGYPGLRSVFDYKLENDNALRQQISNEFCKNYMFWLLLLQFECLFDKQKEKPEDFSGLIDTVLSVAIDESLDNVVMYLMSCIECSLEKNNFKIFSALLRYSPFINSMVMMQRYELVNIIFDTMRRVNKDAFEEMLCNGYLLNLKIDKSLVHSNSLIINCLYSVLKEAMVELCIPANRRCNNEPTSDIPDLVLVSRHISPTRGAVRHIGYSLLEKSTKEIN